MLNLVGAWRLQAGYFVVHETGDHRDIFGAEPFGRVVFAPDGRMIVLITPAVRTPPESASEMAAIFKSIAAYTGRWSIDGERFVTELDGAWDPSWVGTEQVRYYTFDGHTLSLRTMRSNIQPFPAKRSSAISTGYAKFE